MDFNKKFNIGLTLQTNLKEFEEFLKEYHQYIHSIYFSPPVNKYFHTRSKVYQIFFLPGKKKLFWNMLKLAKQYGIELELLLNTLENNSLKSFIYYSTIKKEKIIPLQCIWK